MTVLILAVNSNSEKPVSTGELQDEDSSSGESIRNEQKLVERELVKRLPKSAETPAKAEVADEGVEVISYNNIKDFPLEQDSSVDQLTFEDIKFEARQLALGGHWDEAFNAIDSYKGPEKEAVAELRHEIERAKVKFEEIQNNISATKNTGDLNTSEAVKERKLSAKQKLS